MAPRLSQSATGVAPQLDPASLILHHLVSGMASGSVLRKKVGDLDLGRQDRGRLVDVCDDINDRSVRLSAEAKNVETDFGHREEETALD
jgi:hypothetical protein